MNRRRSEMGFSLVEMLVSVAIMTIIMGAIFEQMNVAMQRSSAEQIKTDLFQEAREFMDQMSRDLRQAGYPNPRNVAPGQLSGLDDPNGAVGLVKVAVDQLVFEGDVDGSGQVDIVDYHLDNTVAGCLPPGKPCLRRNQIHKSSCDTTNYLAGTCGTLTFQTEVQNIQNDTTDPTGAGAIFYAYDANADPVTLPVQLNTNPGSSGDAGNKAMANIRTIKVLLMVESKYRDPKSGLFPYATIVSTVKLNNCSQSPSTGQVMSCQ